MFRTFANKFFSTTSLVSGAINPWVSRIRVPEEFSAKLVENVISKIPSGATSFKPTTLKHIQSQRKMFDDLLEKFPQLKKQFEEAKDSPIIFISGLKTPELAMEKIPTSQYRSDSVYKYPEIKMSEIAAGLIITQFQDIYPQGRAFDLIYPTIENVDRVDSSLSDKKLECHSDGWGSFPEKNVALFCVTGNDSAITEVINSKQIIDYFVENKKEHLLKILGEYFHIYSGGEEYAVPLDKILDANGNIRFSNYGIFVNSSGSTKEANEAIDELKKAIETINPAFSSAMKNGDVLIIDNLKNLHRRITAEGKPSMDPSQANSRLLLRAVLDEWKRGK
jgi:hypothetical protein